jgi:hypothetical protein
MTHTFMRTSKNIQLVVALVSIIFLAGCGTSGNDSLKKETEGTVQSKIVQGVTTKQQVKDMYGSPFSTLYTDGGLEIWKYEFTREVLTAQSYIPVVSWFDSGTKGRKKELTVLFDDYGVVKKFNMSESNIHTSTGLAQ